jgi:hypothetical protein
MTAAISQASLIVTVSALAYQLDQAQALIAELLDENDDLVLENAFLHTELDIHRPKPKPIRLRQRPTPNVVVEAVIESVRQNGIAALRTPDNQDRLRRCDASARREVNRRINKITGGH